MQTTTRMHEFGVVLLHMRRERQLTQLQLAASAAISSRHLSFLETGRARPSEEMVSRLAAAMNADPRCTDDLRTAAGFRAANAIQQVSLGGRIFESALGMETAETTAQIIESGQAVLPLLGITRFFFGTLSGDSKGSFAFDWVNFGAFPESWLQRYDRERYAMTDPLLTVARARTRGFFWDEVIDRRSLARPAREMFERAHAGGISSGFVHLQRLGKSTHIVSMMGQRVDSQSHAVRVGLEILGSRMLCALLRIGTVQGSSSVR